MENLLIDNAEEEMDEKWKEIIQYCLGLPTVFRKILEQFPTKELIQLSLVSKQWNFEARSVLRDRGSLRRKIWLFDCKHQYLERMASNLQQMNVVPYSGIFISMSHKRKCTSSAKESLDPICNAILGRLACKNLEVALKGWNCQGSCPAFIFVQKIFKGYCYGLQELTLNPGPVVDALRNIIQDCEFPRLTNFNMKDVWCDEDGSTANVIKLLVSRAPNLQELSFSRSIQFETNILEGSSAVLVPLYQFRPMEEPVCESLIGALRAKEMAILKDKVELLNGYIPMVLEASSTSLQILEMELFILAPLMCYGICLENVTDLSLFISRDSLRDVQPRILGLLGKFDFTRIFPKLTAVTVQGSREFFSPDRISGFVERGHAVLRNALPDRAINIQHMRLARFHDSDYDLPFFAQMFPNIKTLYVMEQRNDLPFPFGIIWEHFAGLEELDVKITQWTAPAKAGDFCGIFPEEVAELTEKDEEYLKAVNIVPVMPSIRNMTNLRSFKLDVWTNLRWSTEDEILSFRKVTGLLGFARCPALTVTLKMY